MKKRFTSFVLALLMLLTMLPVATFAWEDCTHSRSEAVNWLRSQEGVGYNLDKKYGRQCSDFASAYMNWLYAGTPNAGQGYLPYNAYTYSQVADWNSARWEVIYNNADFQPKPGDIFVFNKGRWTGDTTGHIGVYLSGGKSNAEIIDQDGGSVQYDAYGNVTDEGRGAKIYYSNLNTVWYFLRYKHFTDDTPITHTHSFSSAWTYDSTNHWHKCTGCTEISGKAAHSFNSGIVTSEPTYYDVGIKTHTCTVCGYSYTTEIPRLNPSGYCGGEGDGTNLTWTLDWNTGVLTISGTGKMADYDDGENPAPWYGLNFSAVSIGNRVTTIGDYAFQDGDRLASVTIPDSVTTIGDCAFGGCDWLTSVTIPDSVTTIGDEAFCNCTNLTSVTIPDSVTTIGDRAFEWCYSLTSMSIPGSVTTIGAEAFYYCTSLTDFTVDSDNPSYSNDSNGILFNKEKTKLIQYPVGSTTTNYVIPSQVKDIGNWAFGCSDNLISITIPDGVVSIGEYAFVSCLNLTSVDIPDSVTDIGTWAFSDNSSLTYNIYDNAKYLGNSGNPYLYLVEATDRTIASCDIHPDTRIIGYGAFSWCDNLTAITIPNGVTTIGDYAFEGCNNLTNVTIPDTVTRIGDWAFDQTPWLESLGDFAIVNGILLRYQGEDTSVTVPKTATKIAGAFCYCENITDITIPASVTEFSSWSIFGKCLSLQKLTFLGDAPSVRVTNNIFEEYLIDDLIIHAPKNNSTWTSCDLYDADAQTWSGCSIVFDIDEEMQGNIVASGYCGGEGDGTNLTWTLDSEGKMTISGTGKMADYNKSDNTPPWVTTETYDDDISSIVFSEGVTSVGACAFSYLWSNESVKSITFSGSIVSIGDAAFSGSENLTDVYFPDNTNLTSIGYGAFSNCSSLESITIPDGVTSIGDGVFSQCFVLSSVTIPDGITNIGEYTFYQCPLTSITIPNSVTSIGKYAFLECNKLTGVVIPNNVTSIGAQAFRYCTALTNITIPKAVTDIDEDVFRDCPNVVVSCYRGSTADQYAKAHSLQVKYLDVITPTDIIVTADPSRGITAEIAEILSNNQKVNSFTDTGLDQALAGTPYAGQAAAIKTSVQNVETAGDTTTLIFDVTPYVGDTDVSSAINGTVTFLLPLTAEFTAYAKVLHQGDDIKYYEVQFDSNHNPYIELTTTHFSSFTVSNADEIPGDGGNTGKGGCYVATCVYGSYDCPQVWTLRRFRDETLAKTWYGRLFIHTYYAISPTIVKWFGDTDWFKNMWRGTLDKMVQNLNAQGVPNTAYDDIDW